jgi:hypothetical protein
MRELERQEEVKEAQHQRDMEKIEAEVHLGEVKVSQSEREVAARRRVLSENGSGGGKDQQKSGSADANDTVRH